MSANDCGLLHVSKQINDSALRKLLTCRTSEEALASEETSSVPF